MNSQQKTILTVFFVLVLLIGAVFISAELNIISFSGNSNADFNLAYAQTQDQKTINNDNITSSRRNIITETVKNVSPSIVGINVIEIREYKDPFSSFFDDPFFQRFFGNRGSYSQEVKGLGSGYIISEDGYIVTNDHVAGNATKITITLTDGRQFDAKLIGSDSASDICLLKIDGDDLPYVTLGNSDDIIIGEWVIALGNPFGLFELNDKPTVTVGVVSASGMNLDAINNRYYLNMIQTDASINGGNSGGPLVNSEGKVIGMNTLIFTAGGNTGSIGLGFAIPINKVKRIVEELKKNGSIDRNFEIGMRIQTIDEGIAQYYHLKSIKGVIVTKVYPNTPAEKGGIEVGDIILEVEGYKINNENTIFSVFHEFRAGQTVTLKIIRDEKELTKQMKLVKG
ncbi:MAG: PDZ domain-containing protein [Ignavibacteriota bacterium]|nr:trypsin-like peptidase domain-containing protein [Ignavibacteriales bacterium]MBL1123554.1 PDZ domain-containing protein [Ignavibacteriota bacterium]MCC7094123.1 trypsin-like peptidase domain-containing protein [Ignavibacteriaceae bacterium]MCE7856992.1 PDZ domain-containing protein [Ignavibacteria bacterium CHB3]MEB2296713.1 trypsin-like peptidase domain-containing protein [Ignavibacteria bacterium]